MGMIYLVFCAFRKCLDVLCLLLDVNLWIITSLFRLFGGLLCLLHGLPALLSSSAAGCWNLMLFCALTASEGVTSVAQGSLQLLSGLLQMLGGVSESCKMLGHLLSHVLLRARELLHRGLLSGHSVLRQAWEACSILLSLLLYLVNTVVNLLLIGTQNCLAAVASAWDTVSGPLQEALELSITLLTFLHSSLVGTSVLLWTPCQLALEFLSSLGHILATVFLLNAYGLLLTAAVVTVATIYLCPGPVRLGANNVPPMRRLQRALYRLYLLALERAQATLEVTIWQRTPWPGSQLGARMPQTSGGDRGGSNRDPPNPESTDSLAGNTQFPMDQSGQEGGDGAVPQVPPPGHSALDSPLGPPGKDRQSEGQNMPLHTDSAASLLTLLKEHEERKKCVICQDCVKTVLLLPCRHLCLCRGCADILLQQAAHQHSCPLCRHAILHTMDVYL
nr:E3 ubiquitin-protein ligase RNF26-like [Paramormyrops kingsleyae]